MIRKRTFPMVLILMFIFGLSPFNRAVSKLLTKKQPASLSTPRAVNPMGSGGNGHTGTPGEWYIGQPPPNPKPGAPILLFVQGLNSTAQTWWEDNNMYETAVHHGYQTAFLQLYDAGGASADMWDNGRLLADKIKDIHRYFGNRPLAVIAHSKGGVDAQTALVYYGAWPYVTNVITLSTPHYGSQLADLAYSAWAGWLAKLLGKQGDGTYSMQTAYMESFRQATDRRKEVYYNRFDTMGGNDWGRWFSSTWFGGIYLSQYGENDGVVTVASSRLPYGHEITIGDWDHFKIRTGITFPYFEPVIEKTAEMPLTVEKYHVEKASGESLEVSHWIHGGPLSPGDNPIPVTVEDHVKRLRLDVLSTAQLGAIYWSSPDGKRINAKAESEKTTIGIFKGATHHGLELNHPKPGTWTLHVNADQKDAYLLVSHFLSDVHLNYWKNVSVLDHERGKTKQITNQFSANENIIDLQSLKVTYRMIKEKSAAVTEALNTIVKSGAKHDIILDDPDAIYNITADIEGRTKAGYPFKRTIVETH
jgi:hypothetical protein